MGVVIVTGACGLIGSESVRFFCEKGHQVIGIDNDMRKYFFGKDASTAWLGNDLRQKYKNFKLVNIDIRDLSSLENLFKEYNNAIELVIHTAAQPSHDWAAKEPFVDFHVNASGTLNLLELTRLHCPESVFIFTSTNKVYGDNPNSLPLKEEEMRFEISTQHKFHKGIDESMSIDQCKHSLFGVSKLSADIMVQEYGKYFNMKTAVFRGGCLTGPQHSGAELHGFLSYLMKCIIEGIPYKIFGYKGKQVRDNIHSFDLVSAFYNVFKNPKCGEVYNIGGGRFSNCSMLEAIHIAENMTGNKLKYSYLEDNRIGDHIWYISDLTKFESHYPNWKLTKNVNDILGEIYEANTSKWKKAA